MGELCAIARTRDESLICSRNGGSKYARVENRVDSCAGSSHANFVTVAKDGW